MLSLRLQTKAAFVGSDGRRASISHGCRQVMHKTSATSKIEHITHLPPLPPTTKKKRKKKTYSILYHNLELRLFSMHFSPLAYSTVHCPPHIFFVNCFSLQRLIVFQICKQFKQHRHWKWQRPHTAP